MRPEWERNLAIERAALLGAALAQPKRWRMVFTAEGHQLVSLETVVLDHGCRLQPIAMSQYVVTGSADNLDELHDRLNEEGWL